MSTGFDELLWAVTNYDPEHPDYEELSDIGDGQYLASAAADLIQELRRGLAAAQAELARVRELCPEVLAFAHLMQRKLDANAHKDGQGWDRDGTGKRGWKNCDVSFLRGKLTDEVVELIVAIREPTNHDNVAEEAADVGNIAMMLADVCGALSQPAEQPQREGE